MSTVTFRIADVLGPLLLRGNSSSKLQLWHSGPSELLLHLKRRAASGTQVLGYARKVLYKTSLDLIAQQGHCRDNWPVHGILHE